MAEENIPSSSGNRFDHILSSEQSNIDTFQKDGVIVLAYSDEESESDHLSGKKYLSQVDFCVAIRNSVSGIEVYNLVLGNLSSGNCIYFVLCYF